LNISY